jgi:hypothetical protein
MIRQKFLGYAAQQVKTSRCRHATKRVDCGSWCDITGGNKKINDPDAWEAGMPEALRPF